jgi:hypothetical protein
MSESEDGVSPLESRRRVGKIVRAMPTLKHERTILPTLRPLDHDRNWPMTMSLKEYQCHG